MLCFLWSPLGILSWHWFLCLLLSQARGHVPPIGRGREWLFKSRAEVCNDAFPRLPCCCRWSGHQSGHCRGMFHGHCFLSPLSPPAKKLPCPSRLELCLIWLVLQCYPNFYSNFCRWIPEDQPTLCCCCQCWCWWICLQYASSCCILCQKSNGRDKKDWQIMLTLC